MKLQKIETIELEPSAPFNFNPTFHKPDHFTWVWFNFSEDLGADKVPCRI